MVNVIRYTNPWGVQGLGNVGIRLLVHKIAASLKGLGSMECMVLSMVHLAGVDDRVVAVIASTEELPAYAYPDITVPSSPVASSKFYSI
ncbi:hypothetical protein CVT26_001087 [Gymnopilus dilepis]|uniref:Uncharacterized protein n=1 Tax=Gymnopilus dilepis TaxID=231916 RepID=A0A409X3L2_9AGAR|nr:hypothetical protein CVT26_001087 [Gymnopilus dilepis]